MEGYWDLFAATGAPELYLLYRLCRQEERLAAWMNAAEHAEV